MTDRPEGPRIETGLPGLDEILLGGFPSGSMVACAGRPGTGKTTLAQQICFHQASPERPALYFNTLSEPTAKTLRYLGQFAYFDPTKLPAALDFIDLGGVLRTGGLEQAAEYIFEHVERVKPTLIVVDSFRVFDELARSKEDLRRFGYELAVRLMVWECTSLLLGEYAAGEVDSNPLFSIVDGLILLSQDRASGEPQRFIEVVKMRGTDHSRAAHPFAITHKGIEILPVHRKEI